MIPVSSHYPALLPQLPWYYCLLQYVFVAAGLYLVTTVFIMVGPSRLKDALGMATTPEVRARFQPYMEGLRGLMALNIFFIHAVEKYEAPTVHLGYPRDVFNQELGILSLTYFFFMTGYLLWKTVLVQRGKYNTRRFLRGRLYRTFPAYAVTITLIFVFSFAVQGWRLAMPLWKLLVSYACWLAFSLPGGPPINGIRNTASVGAGVMWTLQMDWCFYLALPLIALFGAHKWKLSGVWVFLIGAAMYLTLDLNLVPASPLTSRLHLLMFYFVSGFGPGMLIAEAKARWPEWPFARTKLASAIVVVLFVGISCFLYWGWSFLHAMALVPAFVLLVYGADLFGFLTSRPAILLGRISYSMYLLHALVMNFAVLMVARLLHFDVMALPWKYYVLLVVPFGALMLILSYLSHVYIELPFTTLGRRRAENAAIGTPEKHTRAQMAAAIQEEAAQLPGQAEAEALLPQRQPEILR